VLAQVTQGSTDDVDAAVKRRDPRQPQMVEAVGHERAKYLYALARLVQKHARLFAVLETLDNGKPIREAATSTCRWPSGISTTTPARAADCRRDARGRNRSASAARSSRGTSRS
jgi:acyl-CoA reductase-like NAD-dependent aldehyde dehydrogenase